MDVEEKLFHIAERYTSEDILEILGMRDEFEPEEVDQMSPHHLVKVYKFRILDNIEEFMV